MDVFFVRHAESVNNLLPHDLGDEFEYARHPDGPLTDRGIVQAERLARRMATEAPGTSIVLTSYLHRALLTAEVLRQAFENLSDRNSREDHDEIEGVASLANEKEQDSVESRQVQVRVYRDLHEIGGHYERSRETTEYVSLPGRTGAETVAEFPTFRVMEPDAVAGGWWRDGPGRETREEALSRGNALLATIAAIHDEPTPRTAATDRLKTGSLKSELTSTSTNQVKKEERRSIMIVTHGYFFRTIFQDWINRGIVVAGPQLQQNGVECLTVEPLQNTAVTAVRFRPRNGRPVAIDKGEPNDETQGTLEVVYQNCVRHVADVGVVAPRC